MRTIIWRRRRPNQCKSVLASERERLICYWRKPLHSQRQACLGSARVLLFLPVVNDAACDLHSSPKSIWDRGTTRGDGIACESRIENKRWLRLLRNGRNQDGSVGSNPSLQLLLRSLSRHLLLLRFAACHAMRIKIWVCVTEV